jgi:hypothetical protein
MANPNTQKDIVRIKATLKRTQEYAWERRYGGLRSLWEDCTMSLEAIERIQGQIVEDSCQEQEK